MKKKVIVMLLAVISALLLYFSWAMNFVNALLAISFIPLMVIWAFNFGLKNSYKIVITLIAMGFGIFNCTSWIYEVNSGASYFICVVYPFIFICPFLLLDYVNRKYQRIELGVLAFVCCWLSFEFIAGYSDFGFPYLILGNSLVSFPSLIQWYEYVGVMGGSLWILVVNSILFLIIWEIYAKREFSTIVWKSIISLVFIITVPIAISCYIFYSFEENGQQINVVALHTSLRCPKKYQASPNVLTKYYVDNSIPAKNANPDLIVWPENALTGFNDLKSIDANEQLRIIKNEERLKATNIVAGIISHEIDSFNLNAGGEKPLLVKYHVQLKKWFRTYNSCIKINNDSVECVFKDKLVPFEESIPYPRVLGKLSSFIQSLGDFSFSLKENEQRSFKMDKGINALPIICYEALFGDFCSNLVSNTGSNVICMILNEGWHQVPKGHNDFNNLAILRAIENRRSIVKASNCGVSSIINTRGDVVKQASGFITLPLKGEVAVNNKMTFYCKYGNIVGVTASCIFISFLGFIVFALIWKKETSA